MAGRRVLVLLLTSYLALDFAVPLVPGAVYFEAGGLKVVQADRGRPAAESVLCPRAPTPTVVRPAPTADPSPPPALGTRAGPCPRRWASQGRHGSPSPSPPAVPDEDH